MEASKINEIMLKFQNLPYQKILFNGSWGIGKTNHVRESIKDQENIYYISLFGKKDIDTFYEELYYLLSAKNKVTAGFEKILKHMEEVNISKFGVNISIPLMADLLTSIQGQLQDKSNIVIVIDDLERKSDSLEIKEIFGFIDAITKNKGVKIILVASSDNFSKEEKKAFDDYAEKSIDRIYEVTTYSKDAPQQILGDEIWSFIKEIFLTIELKNLRTLEKTNFFIQEVIQELGDDIYNDKFNKDDLYKICAAIVIFVVDHNQEMRLLSKTKEKESINSKRRSTFRNEETPSNYIWHYILQRNLNNSMMNSFTSFILDWFKTGYFSRERFNQLYKGVNSYKESKTPIFMSDNQIQEEIDEFSNFIDNLEENISIDNFMIRLDELASIAEATDLEFNYSVDEVVDWLLHDSGYNGHYSDNLLNFLPRKESGFLQQVIEELRAQSLSTYSNRLVSKMVENLDRRDFNNDDAELVKELRIFYDKLKSQNKDKEKEKIITEMKSNNWFLPLPSGEISHSHWTYCHNIFQFIRHIVDTDNEKGPSIKENAHNFFKREIDNCTDQILIYRMNSLMKQHLY